MKFVIYHYRRGPGDPMPMQQEQEFTNEEAALQAAAAILDEGSAAPIHISDETGKVLLRQPQIMRRLGRLR